MNLLSALLLINLSSIQEPKVKKIEDLDKVEMLNSIDDFKQYHTNSFRVNLFRRVSSQNRELNGSPLVNYIIGILNYSDMEPANLYEVGAFYDPQIMSSVRLTGALKITIEHGKGQIKKILTLIITKEGVKVLDN